jgi:hypothetical protein
MKQRDDASSRRSCMRELAVGVVAGTGPGIALTFSSTTRSWQSVFYQRLITMDACSDTTLLTF